MILFMFKVFLLYHLFIKFNSIPNQFEFLIQYWSTINFISVKIAILSPCLCLNLVWGLVLSPRLGEWDSKVPWLGGKSFIRQVLFQSFSRALDDLSSHIPILHLFLCVTRCCNIIFLYHDYDVILIHPFFIEIILEDKFFRRIWKHDI